MRDIGCCVLRFAARRIVRSLRRCSWLSRPGLQPLPQLGLALLAQPELFVCESQLLLQRIDLIL
jgi:hypothetical protein